MRDIEEYSQGPDDERRDHESERARRRRERRDQRRQKHSSELNSDAVAARSSATEPEEGDFQAQRRDAVPEHKEAANSHRHDRSADERLHGRGQPQQTPISPVSKRQSPILETAFSGAAERERDSQHPDSTEASTPKLVAPHAARPVHGGFRRSARQRHRTRAHQFRRDSGLGRVSRRARIGWQRMMRRSVTARAIGESIRLLSPDRIAELPAHVGRTCRRVYLQSTSRKGFAQGFFASVKGESPFAAGNLIAPLSFLLRKTATRPARALAISASGAGHRFLSGIDRFLAAVPSGAAVVSAPWRWWTRLLDAADASYHREANAESVGKRSELKEPTREARSTLAIPVRPEESPDRRRTAWTLAAVTGVAGVILTFILQFSQSRPSMEAAETKVATNRKRQKPDIPLKSSGDLVGFEERFHHRVPPPAPVEPLPIPDEPTTELARSEVIVPMSPQLDMRWIALRRERQVAEELPIDDFVVHSERRPDELTAREDRDEWSRFVASTEAIRPPRSLAYSDKLHPLDRERVERDLKSTAPPETAPLAGSEVQLKIEKRLPRESSPGEAAAWELVVRNEGRDPIDRLQIEDQIPDPRRVTQVSPVGVVVDHAIQWAIGPLRPGAEQVLRIEMTPEDEGRIDAVSRIRSFAAVSFTTEVAGPKLQLEVESPEKLKAGDACRIRFRIRNTGEAEADNVVLREALPAELDHREGRKLDYEVGKISPGESREAQLTVLAAAPGIAVHQAVLLSNGKVHGAVEKRVEIAERPKEIAKAPAGTPPPPQRRVALPRRPSMPPPDVCRPILASPECLPMLR